MPSTPSPSPLSPPVPCRQLEAYLDRFSSRLSARNAHQVSHAYPPHFNHPILLQQPAECTQCPPGKSRAYPPHFNHPIILHHQQSVRNSYQECPTVRQPLHSNNRTCAHTWSRAPPSPISSAERLTALCVCMPSWVCCTHAPHISSSPKPGAASLWGVRLGGHALNCPSHTLPCTPPPLSRFSFWPAS